MAGGTPLIPKIFWKPKGSITQWRMKVLIPFVMEREGFMCWVDACYINASDVHEGVVTRGMVQGWPIKQRLLAHNPLNCVALCKLHHKIAPSKQEVLDWMIQEYGKDLILWYFRGLPFKQFPRELDESLKRYEGEK